MGGEVLLLFWYVSALAVYIDGHEGEVALDATSRCKVDLEPEAVAAGGAGHAAEGGSFTGRHGRVSVQRDLKGDSPAGGAEGGERECVVSLTWKQQTTSLL